MSLVEKHRNKRDFSTTLREIKANRRAATEPVVRSSQIPRFVRHPHRVTTAPTPVASCNPVDGRLVAAWWRDSPTIVEFLLVNREAELRRHPSALVEAERARVTRRVDPEPDAVLAALPEARE